MDGQEIRDRSQLPGLVDKRLKALDFISARVRGGYARPEAEALLSRIEEARSRYQQLLSAR